MLGKRPGSWLCLCALSIFGSVLAESLQLQKLYDFETSREYTLPGGSKLAYVGACSYDEERISCWDPDGQPAPNLSERIARSYDEPASPHLAFGLHMKDRLVVFSRPGGAMSLGIVSATGGLLPQGEAGEVGDPEQLAWVSLKLPPDTRAVSLLAVADGISGGPSVSEPFSIGAKVSYEGGTFCFTATHFGDPPRPRARISQELASHSPWRGKSWDYYLQLENLDRDNLQLKFDLCDKSGAPILFVDRNGVPVSELAYWLENPPVAPGKAPLINNDQIGDQKYGSVMPGWVHATKGITAMNMNVDPAYVGSIRVSSFESCRVLFKDLPVDPK